MKFFQKIQQLNIFWKRAIIFFLLFILIIPFIFFIKNNFQGKATKLNKEKLLKDLKIPQIGKKIGESLEGFEEIKREIEKNLKEQTEALQEQAITPTTTDFETSATNTE